MMQAWRELRLALRVSGDTGACEQRRGVFHMCSSRTPLAAPGERGRRREACQKAAAAVQTRDDGVAVVISRPWGQRRGQAQHPLSCIRERAARLLHQHDGRTLCLPKVQLAEDEVRSSPGNSPAA